MPQQQSCGAVRHARQLLADDAASAGGRVHRLLRALRRVISTLLRRRRLNSRSSSLRLWLGPRPPRRRQHGAGIWRRRRAPLWRHLSRHVRRRRRLNRRRCCHAACDDRRARGRRPRGAGSGHRAGQRRQRLALRLLREGVDDAAEGAAGPLRQRPPYRRHHGRHRRHRARQCVKGAQQLGAQSGVGPAGALRRRNASERPPTMPCEQRPAHAPAAARLRALW